MYGGINRTHKNYKIMARKHKMDEVLRTLGQKQDCRINNGQISILTDNVFDNKTGESKPNQKKKYDLGNGSWGKIDFLVHYCGYSKVFVNNF